MTDLEYLLLTSMMPVGTLILAAFIVYLTRDKPDHPRPGE